MNIWKNKPEIGYWKYHYLTQWIWEQVVPPRVKVTKKEYILKPAKCPHCGKEL